MNSHGARRRIFLSYRRADAAGQAGRLADHLLERFGSDSVFMDVESIEAGADFTLEIEHAIANADAVVVVIGPAWLDARTPTGTRRLDEPDDLVRREIEVALSTGVRIVPVLVGGALMPSEAHLPSAISALARRNAVELLDRRWREDIRAFLDVLEERDRGTPRTLPVPTTSFLGRDRELQEVIDLLRQDSVRILTLTGPGGIGKTRLALQAASSMTHAYGGGVWFVGLASVSDPDVMLAEIARVLDLQDPVQGTVTDAVARGLSAARTLIVLDNLEQLLPDAAGLVAQLSDAAPTLDLIVTSRQRLHVVAEREYVLDTLSEDGAIEMFVDRAQAGSPDFSLRDDAEREVVRAVCARLDRLPLAIELAAARTRLLDPEAMLSRLDHRLTLLTGGARDLPARQQTLRATIDWSYELLSGSDRRLFACLSVFAGGWTLAAAEIVCASTAEDDVLAGMESLTQNSLIQRRAADGRARFLQLETVREYAAEVLHAAGERDALSERHAEYYLSEAELARAELLGPHPEAWFARIEPELVNFREAIRSCLARGREPLAVKITAALMASLEPSGHWQEARAIGLDEVVARSFAVTTPERAELLFAAGSLTAFQGRTEPAQALLEEAVHLARKVDDRRILARALVRLAWVCLVRGENRDASIALGEEGVGLARELDDPWVLAETTNDLAEVFGDISHSSRAVALLQESLQLRRSIAYVPGIAASLSNLGWQALLGEDYGTAITHLEESLELARRLEQRPLMLMIQDNLAVALLLDGDPVAAAPLFRENLRICREMDDKRVAEEVLIGLAGVAGAQRDWRRAAWLAGAAAALAAQLELSPTDVTPRIHARYLSAARQALGEETYDQAYERGRLASFDEAVVYALEAGA